MGRGYSGRNNGHQWVIACVVVIEPDEIKAFQRKTATGNSRTQPIEIPGRKVDVLDIYCDKCGCRPHQIYPLWNCPGVSDDRQQEQANPCIPMGAK